MGTLCDKGHLIGLYSSYTNANHSSTFDLWTITFQAPPYYPQLSRDSNPLEWKILAIMGKWLKRNNTSWMPYLPFTTKKTLKPPISIPFDCFEFPAENTEINPNLIIPVNGEQREYILKGITYFGQNHFTSRIISDENVVWYHDGMTTGPTMEHQGPLHSIPDLTICKGR